LCSRYFFLDKKVPKKSRTCPPAALEKDLTCGKSETRCAQTVGLSYRKQGLFPSFGPAASVMVRKGYDRGWINKFGSFNDLM
jgi:hypothetical protein